MLLALRAFCKKQLLKNNFFFSGPKHFMDSRFMDVLCSLFIAFLSPWCPAPSQYSPAPVAGLCSVVRKVSPSSICPEMKTQISLLDQAGSNLPAACFTLSKESKAGIILSVITDALLCRSNRLWDKKASCAAPSTSDLPSGLCMVSKCCEWGMINIRPTLLLDPRGYNGPSLWEGSDSDCSGVNLEYFRWF